MRYRNQLDLAMLGCQLVHDGTDGGSLFEATTTIDRAHQGGFRSVNINNVV
jgi:hypothetical protein